MRVLRHKGGWGLRGERRASGTRSRAARPRAVSALSIASARARGRARICTHRGHRGACWVAMARAAAGRASLAGASGRRAAAQRGRARRDRRLRRQRGLRSAQRGRARLSNLGFGNKDEFEAFGGDCSGRWSSGIESDWRSGGPGFDSRSRRSGLLLLLRSSSSGSLQPHASRLTPHADPATQHAAFCAPGSGFLREGISLGSSTVFASAIVAPHRTHPVSSLDLAWRLVSELQGRCARGRGPRGRSRGSRTAGQADRGVGGAGASAQREPRKRAKRQAAAPWERQVEKKKMALHGLGWPPARLAAMRCAGCAPRKEPSESRPIHQPLKLELKISSDHLRSKLVAGAAVRYSSDRFP